MLRGLDEAGWDELSHAYGKAVDTPDLLRQAASPDGEAAQKAVSELNGSIFHQGTVYSATVAAVPFLVELARRAAVGSLQAEADVPVRASLALAPGLTDPVAAGPVLADAVLTAAPPVRVAAAVALLRAGLPWPEGAAASVVAAIDDDAEVAYCWTRTGDWSDELVVAPPAPVALDVLGTLLRSPVPQTRELGLRAASVRCDASRSAPPQIVPVVATALHDPDPGARNGAVDTLSRAALPTTSSGPTNGSSTASAKPSQPCAPPDRAT